MVVQHNMQAVNTNRQLGINVGAQAKSTEKLSSGYKINRAGDDAAGLSISEKMRNQIKGLNRASTNAQDGISLIQTAEGTMQEVHSILQRMGELATQAANDVNETVDRESIQSELTQLREEIDSIASKTAFNGTKLLDGNYTGKYLQVGANSGENMKVSINKMDSTALTLTASDIGVSSHANASAVMSKVTAAIKYVSKSRSALGAVQNRLEHTISNLDNYSENMQSAESRVRDTDMANEMVNYSKNNILQQAAQSMLAQANQSNQSVLSLLQ